MIYKSTSIRGVIGQVIRNTRLQDTSYIADMHEWIPEAMGLMKTKVVLSPAWKDVVIYFHIGELPDALDHITAVEWGGRRLPQATNPRHMDAAELQESAKHYEQRVSVTISQEGPQVYQSVTTSVTDCYNLPVAYGHFYDIEMGYIKTSMADATVRVYYKMVPLDADGLPLIPDNEDYKFAIYWYVRSQMIGAGFEDKVFRYDQCMAYFEKHAARAMGSIRYPSVDQMELKIANLNRLIKMPGDYFDSFFGTKQVNTSEMTVATTPIPISKTTTEYLNP